MSASDNTASEYKPTSGTSDVGVVILQSPDGKTAEPINSSHPLPVSDADLLAAVGVVDPQTATIAFNPAAQASNAIVLGGRIPGGFRVSAVASSGYVAISVTRDGTNWGYMYSGSSIAVIPTVATRDKAFADYVDPSAFIGVKQFKFVNCDVAGTPANQITADAVFIVGIG